MKLTVNGAVLKSPVVSRSAVYFTRVSRKKNQFSPCYLTENKVT